MKEKYFIFCFACKISKYHLRIFLYYKKWQLFQIFMEITNFTQKHIKLLFFAQLLCSLPYYDHAVK